MKRFNLIIVISISTIFLGCATTITNTVLLDETRQYPSTKNVHIINSPFQPYHVIAELETYGYNGESIPQLLDNMRKEVMSIGANAIIPTEENLHEFQIGTIFNPWIREFQSIGTQNISIVKGLAIVYNEEFRSDEFATLQGPIKNLHFGAGINLLPVAFNGIGGAVWIKYKKMRYNIEYFNSDVPKSYYSGNLEKGVTKDAFRVGIDYFFWKNLPGIYLPIGFEYWNNSLRHKQFETRAEFDTKLLSLGIGYLYNITENVYLDSRLSMGTLLGGVFEVQTNDFTFLPRTVSHSAMLGLGFRL